MFRLMRELQSFGATGYLYNTHETMVQKKTDTSFVKLLTLYSHFMLSFVISPKFTTTQLEGSGVYLNK